MFITERLQADHDDPVLISRSGWEASGTGEEAEPLFIVLRSNGVCVVNEATQLSPSSLFSRFPLVFLRAAALSSPSLLLSFYLKCIFDP